MYLIFTRNLLFGRFVGRLIHIIRNKIFVIVFIDIPCFVVFFCKMKNKHCTHGKYK